MKELLEILSKNLVDHPDAISVTEVPGDGVTTLQLRVAAADMGKVIGKQGRIAKAIRSVVKAAAIREGKRVFIEIVQS